jgi:hypothetical protein
MSELKHAYFDSLEEDDWIPQEPPLVRRRLPARPGQPATNPGPCAPSSPTRLDPPVVGRGLSPATNVIARALLNWVTSQPRALVRWQAYETVEGEVLTPGSAFKTDGGPYVQDLTARGKRAVKNLCITNGLKFVARCWSPAGEWIEAWHRGKLVRLFLSPLPSPTSMPGLVLAPYVIHRTYWQKGMQRALDRARASRASRASRAAKNLRVGRGGLGRR